MAVNWDQIADRRCTENLPYLTSTGSVWLMKPYRGADSGPVCFQSDRSPAVDQAQGGPVNQATRTRLSKVAADVVVSGPQAPPPDDPN